MLLVFEGIDGSGKDTQIENVSYMLKKVYKDKIQTMRPVLGLNSDKHRKHVSNIINMSGAELSPLTVANVFIENMLELSLRVRELIERGYIVLMNRWYYSTIAYNGIDVDTFNIILSNIRKLIKEYKLLVPDLVIYLDVPPTMAMERILKRNKPLEQYENLAVLKKVSERYLGILSTQEFEDILPYNNKVILASGSLRAEELTHMLLEEIYIAIGV